MTSTWDNRLYCRYTGLINRLLRSSLEDYLASVALAAEREARPVSTGLVITFCFFGAGVAFSFAGAFSLGTALALGAALAFLPTTGAICEARAEIAQRRGNGAQGVQLASETVAGVPATAGAASATTGASPLAVPATGASSESARTSSSAFRFGCAVSSTAGTTAAGINPVKSLISVLVRIR